MRGIIIIIYSLKVLTAFKTVVKPLTLETKIVHHKIVTVLVRIISNLWF